MASNTSGPDTADTYRGSHTGSSSSTDTSRHLHPEPSPDNINDHVADHLPTSHAQAAPAQDNQADDSLSDAAETDADADSVFTHDEGFGDYGSSASSFYSNLRAEAEDYYWENGRRYHEHNLRRYPLPNDDIELDREDMKHHMWRLVLEGKLHLAPMKENPSKILDLGTGSGIWAMEVADQYPSAEVIGTDISPVQPKWVPPNLHYEIDDLEQEWLFRSNSFDFINVRFMFYAIKDWPAMLQQAYRTLKPGGYIELSELALQPVAGDDCPSPPTITQWFKIQGAAIEKAGFDMHVACRYKQMLIDAGFEAVVEEKMDIPWGTWPEDRRSKAIGFWHVEQLKQGLQGIALATLTRSGWSVAEVELFLASLRQEMGDRKYRFMDHAYIAYGRKPLT